MSCGLTSRIEALAAASVGSASPERRPSRQCVVALLLPLWREHCGSLLLARLRARPGAPRSGWVRERRWVCCVRRGRVSDAHDEPTLAAPPANFFARSAPSAGLLRRPAPGDESKCGASWMRTDPRAQRRTIGSARTDVRPPRRRRAMIARGSAGSPRKMPRGSYAHIPEPTPTTGPTIIGRVRRRRC